MGVVLRCALATALLFGCGDDDAVVDAGVDAGVDSGRPDLGPPPAWPGTFMDTGELAERRGRVVARSIVHVHSPLSHDACDGEGWVDGALADEACLAHFAEAVCALRIDAVFLTDHAPHVDEVAFADALWIGEALGAEPLSGPTGDPVASRLTCPDGHSVELSAGSENELMPLGLDRHPTVPEGASLGEGYEGSTPEVLAGLRDAGALIWVAHTEEKSPEWLRRVEPDGLELYNLHANVDPRIRTESLGLEAAPFLPDLLEFTRAAARLAPDLAVMTFLDPNRVALARWDELLAEGTRVAASGGCDAHENALGMELTDGERADSYRRMMSWITNHVLADSRSVADVEAALGAGRNAAVVEVLGTPIGFDFHATGADTWEMGDTAPLGSTLVVGVPRVDEGHPQDPAPSISAHLLRATAGGAVEVARATEGELRFEPSEPGAYRVEVRIVPHHTAPFLGSLAERLVRELPWVHSNAIHVE